MPSTKNNMSNMGTIVFLHGNSSSSRVFTNILNDESIKHSMVAIDLPGHGENNKGYSETDYSVPNLCNYLIEKINSIDDDILLVGNSLGGHLAIEIAPRIKYLRGLIVHGTPPLKKPINMEEGYVSIPEFATFLTENPSEEEIKSIIGIIVYKEEVRKILVNEFKKADNKVRAVLVKDIVENNFIDEFQLFTTLEVPKCIILGDKDVSVNTNYLKMVKDSCDKNCELITLKNCGHYHSLEKPKEYIEIIKKMASKAFNYVSI